MNKKNTGIKKHNIVLVSLSISFQTVKVTIFHMVTFPVTQL